MPVQRPSPISDRDPIPETNEMTMPDTGQSPSGESVSVTDAESVSRDSEPAPAAIAQEAAAIYPDTNEGRPTPEEIAAEAYRIYMGRGAAPGGDLDDWLDAERRLSQARRTEP